MLHKIKRFFVRPSRFDQAVYNEVQELRQQVNNLESHLVTVARCSLIKPDRFYRESQNTKANAEYLVNLVKAKKESHNE